MGVFGMDKRIGSTFGLTHVDQASAEQIWRGDDIASRCVETIPDEMLREGFQIRVAEDREASEEFDEAHRELDTVEAARLALQYARAFGGAGILLGADDGTKDLSKPLAEDRIRSFKWLSVYTPNELQPVTYYSDPLQPKYGEIAVYRLCPLNSPPGSQAKFPLVHESRIVRIAGAATTRSARLNNIHPGWEDSIFTRIAQVIHDFQMGWHGASILLTDFATPTLKIKGLAKALAGTGSNEMSITTRARALELCRSIARVSIVDSEEEYKRETTTVTGLADMLDKLALRVAAAASMPVSLLMGQSPAGLNATGDSDIRWFYDQIKSMQKRKLKPALRRITEIMMLSKEGPSAGQELENWDVDFPELWQLTELEQVTAHKAQADADAVYINAQVATPEEIAKSRFGGDKYSTRTVIDMAIREEMQAEGEQQKERLAAPPPVDPNAAPEDGKGAEKKPATKERP